MHERGAGAPRVNEILGSSVLTCPSCHSAETLHIAADATGRHQWTARCEACDHSWSFTDDLT